MDHGFSSIQRNYRRRVTGQIKRGRNGSPCQEGIECTTKKKIGGLQTTQDPK